ncbi:chalcone isomerase family protein [Litoribacillus peritrichatus]|uniref:Chalcone isomerase family protein n=1 Tax=Litoribacillus peritrichatus TaxID=718191 RepID=A0ABP7M6M8_9GAMM
MFKKIIACGAMVCAMSASAMQVADVEVPEKMSAGSSNLILNGAGIRDKLFLDLYVAGLYLESKGLTAEQVVNADQPMALRLHIISGLITAEKMVNATNEGFEMATGGNTAAIKSEIEQFISVFREEIKEGDVFDLVYVPGVGVNVTKNGVEKDVVKGVEFKKAMFGIWLSDNPVHDGLKAELLGS